MFRKLSPRQIHDSDEFRRRTQVLKFILIGAITLGIIATLFVVVESLALAEEYSGLAVAACVALTMVLFGCYILNSKGHVKLASVVVAFLAYGLATYTLVKWGVLVPQGVLAYGMLVVIIGVLLGSRASFMASMLCGISLASMVYLEGTGQLSPDLTWTNDEGTYADVVIYILSFMILSLVAWLSNRDIEHSLWRALTSEALLMAERDNLEASVARRTKEIERLQAEKISELQRFAEFGRMGASLLHDLASPLMAASLDLDSMEQDRRLNMINQVKRSIYQIERYIEGARRQLESRSGTEEFDVIEEIKLCLHVFESRARNLSVSLDFPYTERVMMKGDSALFTKIVSNLVGNALDAYGDARAKLRIINIGIIVDKHKVTIAVEDYAGGIPARHISHIFEAFYTTKHNRQGMGLGLSIVKDIVETNFKGKIFVNNLPKGGVRFSIEIPL
ncbi:HAMP domain-containing histidine kinase [Candidatus Saccharibacteria bacterium]|nr:HAMP domain-containing histidine kinase [Candidatus Saccharibacteria bacterium]